MKATLASIIVICLILTNSSHGYVNRNCVKSLGGEASSRSTLNWGHYSIAEKLNRTEFDYRRLENTFKSLPEFNRMTGLYQFAINYSDPTLKNRKTHSLDVSDVARELALRLGVSEPGQSLASTLGIIHDLGHPVFSHWGETALRKRLKPHHVDWNHDSAGLNSINQWSTSVRSDLFPEVIEGLAKRFWKYDPKLPLGFNNHHREELPVWINSIEHDLNLENFNHFEGQIAAQADRISFNSTDIADGLRVGRFKPSDLKANFPSAYQVLQSTLTNYSKLYKFRSGSAASVASIRSKILATPELLDYVYRQFTPRFREHQIEDLLTETSKNLNSLNLSPEGAATEIRLLSGFVVDFSNNLKSEFKTFAEYCRKEVFATKTAPLEKIADELIQIILDDRYQMPDQYHQKFKNLKSQGERLILIAEFLTRAINDRDALLIVQKYSPELYHKYFPGYEVNTQIQLDENGFFENLTSKLNSSILEKDKAKSSRIDHTTSMEILTKPSSQEIENIAKEFIRSGETNDPRNPNSANVQSTIDQYVIGHDKNGRRIYDQSRENLHQEIIQQSMTFKTHDNHSELKQKAGQEPFFICVSGGMSVGMTYMQRLMIQEGIVNPKNTVIITPMSFMPLPEFAIRTYYQHPEKSPLLVDEYYDIVQKIVDAALAKGLNILIVDQADAKFPILNMTQSAKSAGYQTAMIGMTMTPEAYYAASELWLTKFNRIPDHQRGFGDLKEFAENWTDFYENFDYSALFETYFHVNDIDKSEDDTTRKEYTVTKVMTVEATADHKHILSIQDPSRFHDFIERGLFINPNSKAPEEARRNYPYKDSPQLEPNSVIGIDEFVADESSNPSLTLQMRQFISGDFESKFKALVKATSEKRARDAQKR